MGRSTISSLNQIVCRIFSHELGLRRLEGFHKGGFGAGVKLSQENNMTYYGFSEVGPMTKEAEKKCVQPSMSYYTVENYLKYLSGQMLTVVEATTTDPEQRKATKDIVKKFFSDAMLNVYHDVVNRGEGSSK